MINKCVCRDVQPSADSNAIRSISMCIYTNSYIQQLHSLSSPSKYLTWYCNIITAARFRADNRNSAKLLFGYVELHHTIPKSFNLGGIKDRNNHAYLTAREHVVCHWLLTKITTGQYKSKMLHAFWMMCAIENTQQQRHRVTSRTYEYAKRQLSILHSGRIPWNKGKHGYLTQAQRQLMSEANRAKGPQSSETIAKRIAKTTGLHRSNEQKANISKSLIGRVVTEETRSNQSAAAKTRTKQSRYKGDPASLRPSATSVKWQITTPSNSKITVIGLAKWCREVGISYGLANRAANANKPYKGYTFIRS